MKVGLALGSGGAKGYAHIAYLEVLDQLYIKTSAIAGASMGALIGAFYASGMGAREIRRLAESVSFRSIPHIVDLAGPLDGGIIKGRKIEDWIAENLKAKRFEDLKVPLRIVATDFWRKEQVVFDSGELVPAIRASISIPGVFEPYSLGGRLLVDGGVVNPVPIDLLGDADFVVGIDVSGERAEEAGKDPGRLEVLLGAYGIMGQIIMERRAVDEKVSVYLKPTLRGYNSMEFLKAAEIIESVRDDAEGFRRALIAAKVDRKARDTDRAAG
ncbi:MAG TPA: patatin-like phospholipase family protein [Rectinemataceae bacterium]|nr:patatin-like phospholipase family protein [Rectinemataceae bacterium]